MNGEKRVYQCTYVKATNWTGIVLKETRLDTPSSQPDNCHIIMKYLHSSSSESGIVFVTLICSLSSNTNVVISALLLDRIKHSKRDLVAVSEIHANITKYHDNGLQ